MISEFYFFDQFSRASHVGGVRRCKRYSEDFNQALYHVKVALSIEDDESDRTETTTSCPIKQQTNKQTGDTITQTILRKLKTPMLPEILTKELDTVLQLYDDKSNRVSSPILSQSAQFDFIDNKTEPTAAISNLPKISLPGSLIVGLHSTWSDLIQNTEYNFKIWRTKTGEETWRKHLERKRFEQLNPKQHEYMIVNKQVNHRRPSLRLSVASSTNLSHRQSITTNFKRPLSRGSLLSTTTMLQDNIRLIKAMHQNTSDNLIEPIKNGIHIEFKLSTETDEIKQEFNEPKIVVFDVSKPANDFDEDIITLIQNKCKRLLAEAKQKIIETTEELNIDEHTKMCRIWFYEDNQYIRNKTNVLTTNESNRRRKSKFVMAILRREIPEKYNVKIEIPIEKHKYYIELMDGSMQIYYPSGRLAVIRLRSPLSTTLFFDDTNLPANRFLGLVTSTGSVLLMQPTYHARFITDNKHECAYLCNGKTGLIEKRLQWNSINNSKRQSILTDEDHIIPPLFGNTVQLQLNSFMQLEYYDATNISFAFTCQNEVFKLQLGANPPILVDILSTKKNCREKKFQIKSKLSNSTEMSDVPEKQHIQFDKVLDEQVNLRQLPMMRELILLRKRIKQICDSWLKECRTTLGIMNIDDYHLPDFPPSSILTQTKHQINSINYCKSAKQSRHIPILTKRASSSNIIGKSLDRQQFLRTCSTEKFESNVIANAFEQFVPHSDAGHTIKQRFYRRKKVYTNYFPNYQVDKQNN